jgi:hypothetical protein
MAIHCARPWARAAAKNTFVARQESEVEVESIVERCHDLADRGGDRVAYVGALHACHTAKRERVEGASVSAFAFATALALACAARTASAAGIAFVPLDDRPVTLQLPEMLGAIAGQPLAVPPRALVGHYLERGDPDAILRWLQTPPASDATALVASLDMIAYGGLVASRAPGVSTSEAYARVRTLAHFKAQHPDAFVGVFGTIMRLAPTGVPRLGAAAEYYAAGDTVDEIAAYANLPDPPQTPEDARQAAVLRAQIGPTVLAAYLRARERNRNVDEWALQMAAEGGFDRIVIGQDDAGPAGLHLRDVAALRQTSNEFGLGERASIEPGADELGMVVLARALALGAAWRPAVRVVYSRSDGGAYGDPLEFVPIDATISRLVDACGARRVTAGADVDLFVRVPATGAADESVFEDAIASDIARGAPVAAADLSFLEGKPGAEQRRLTEALIARGVAGKLDAFASWNTDANTVGTALAAAIAAGAGRRTHRFDAVAHAEFMLDRYIDDYAFHQFVRPALNDALRAQGIDTSLLLRPVAAEAGSENRAALWPYALELLKEIYPQYADRGLTITLPWQRTFETQIDVRLGPAQR